MMRKFIDSELEDDVRKVYLPYEDFHVSKGPGLSQYSLYVKPKVPISFTKPNSPIQKLTLLCTMQVRLA